MLSWRKCIYLNLGGGKLEEECLKSMMNLSAFVTVVDVVKIEVNLFCSKSKCVAESEIRSRWSRLLKLRKLLILLKSMRPSSYSCCWSKVGDVRDARIRWWLILKLFVGAEAVEDETEADFVTVSVDEVVDLRFVKVVGSHGARSCWWEKLVCAVVLCCAMKQRVLAAEEDVVGSRVSPPAWEDLYQPDRSSHLQERSYQAAGKKLLGRSCWEEAAGKKLLGRGCWEDVVQVCELLQPKWNPLLRCRRPGRAFEPQGKASE